MRVAHYQVLILNPAVAGFFRLYYPQNKPLLLPPSLMPKLEQTSKSSQVNWYVYMIRADDNSLYTGVTTDVERRLNEHQSNPKLAAKYFRARKATSLEFSYETQSKKQAYQLEYRIKRLTKSVKEKLVAGKVKIEDIIEI